MAFTDRLDFEQMPVFYNVTMAVGRNCPNIRDDVLLVQYMLNYIYNQSNPAIKPPTSEPLWLDGKCGRNTCAYILQFQKDVVRLNGTAPIRVDGRVDPARGGGLMSSVSKTIYTIIHINAAFKKRYRGDFNRFPSDPTLPGLLGARLTGFTPGVVD